MLNKRQVGKQNEDLVKKYFEKQGYKCLKQNFTIRGGEIDLIFQKDNEILFIEVKSVHDINDFHGYISTKKLKSLNKSIQYFLFKNGFKDKDIDLKFVFVKNGKITDIYDLN